MALPTFHHHHHRKTMQTTTTARGQNLRPVGTIEAPDGYNGDRYTGTLATDADGQLWVYGKNERSFHFLFPVNDHYAAKHCTSLGNAPTVEARP